MSGWRRFVMLLALGALAAGVFVATAAALAFSDDSCDNTKPCRPPEGVVGAAYSHVLKAMPNSGNGPPYSFVLINGSLPPGLSLASNGPITGTPTAAGTWTFWVELQDKPTPPEFWCKNRGTCAQRDFTIKVGAGISINNQTAKVGTLGQTYSEQLTATSVVSLNPTTGQPATTATWSVASGALPPGVTLGADGLLSGTPTTEGSYTFVVRAELDPSRWDTETLTIVVRTPVQVTASTVPPSELGVPFRLALVASGGTGAGTYQWALTTGALPEGIALGPDGTVTGTPEVAGAFAFTATATDAEGRTADFAGRILVANRLSITTVRLRAGKVGRLYRAKLATTGGVVPKKWKVTKGPLPRGIRLDRTLGVLSGTPKKPGRYRVTFEARDALKVTSKKTLVIEVLA